MHPPCEALAQFLSERNFRLPENTNGARGPTNVITYTGASGDTPIQTGRNAWIVIAGDFVGGGFRYEREGASLPLYQGALIPAGPNGGIILSSASPFSVAFSGTARVYTFADRVSAEAFARSLATESLNDIDAAVAQVNATLSAYLPGLTPQNPTIESSGSVNLSATGANMVWENTAPEWCRTLRFIGMITGRGGTSQTLRADYSYLYGTVGRRFNHAVGYFRVGPSAITCEDDGAVIIDVRDTPSEPVTQVTANRVLTIVHAAPIARSSGSKSGFSLNLSGSGGPTVSLDYEVWALPW